jgi:phage baseplate assembly protein W
VQSPRLVNGDLYFENGELVMVDAGSELAQCAEIVLGTNLGEWFLNPAMGIDFKAFVDKRPSDVARREQIRQWLRQEPRIQQVESIDFKDDYSLRTSSVKFVASGALGEVAEGGVNGIGIG